jgi:hypothetical protein
MPTVTLVFELADPEVIVHDALFTELKYGNAGRG